MKKIYYLVALCATILLPQLTMADDFQIPNSGFENWEYDALNQFEDGQRPVGWNTSNIKKTVIGITAGANMVFPDGNPHSGTYCAKAINTEVGAAGIKETSPAWFTLGKPWSYIDGINTGSATAGTDGGIAFTHRPDTMQLWIKRTSSGTENAHIVFYSWKGTSKGTSYKNKDGKCSSVTHYDEESDIRIQADGNECTIAEKATQVAEAQWRSMEQFKDWTLIRVPIRYLTDEKPEKANIIISAANYPNKRANEVQNNATIWADDIQLIYSSTLHEIKIVRPGETIERPIAGVSPSITEYTYSLGQGATATDIPEIRCYRSGRRLTDSECQIVYASELDKPSTITIYAEDGSSSSTYQVTFAAKKSDNANPAGITIDGEALTGFVAYNQNYDIDLPYGTKQCPQIDVIKGEEEQTYTVNCTGVPGVATIVVTAADGTTKKTYTLNLSVGKLTDNTLADILVNGVSLTGFAPTKTKYKVELPLGTTAAPTITPVSAYPEGEQTITVVDGGLNGTTTITVTPQGGTPRTYSISYIITESSYALLKDIQVGGVSLQGFDPEVKSYNYALPLGVNEVPAITYVKGDAYQTVDVLTGGVDGVTTITVTSQNGTKVIYRITFSAVKSSVSTLKDILLNGESLAGFDANTTAYKVQLPQGTTAAPAVTYVKGDDYQTVTLNEGGLTGTTRIVVVAQDGSVTTYTITFEVQKSSNATLQAIMLDGKMLDGFSATKTNYEITLPRGTTKLPEITWTAADASQTIRKVEGGVNGETKITVKAQTGAITVYSLKFSVETNNNVNLNEIKIDGVTITGFQPSVLDYTVELPAGTTLFPDITYTKADAAQSVVVTKGGLNGTTQILVKAEDGTTRIYTITFSVQKSENAFLKMIYVDGQPLAGFVPSTLNYNYVLSAAVTQCPDITVDKEVGQNVSIAVPKITGMVRIEVTPESGSKNVYTIDINYPQSNNSKLQSITLDGRVIEGWNANTTDYTITLPASTTAIPVVGYVLGESKQSVITETNAITGDTKLIVKAENGETTTYHVIFNKLKSTNARLANILLDGVSIAGFNPTKTDYQYILPAGTTAAPVITYVKGDERQHVTLISPAVEGNAQLVVVSEDASASTTYSIKLAFQPSSNKNLEKIILTQRSVVYEKMLTMDDFATSDTITIDWIADIPAPTATYVAAEERQMVALADAGLNGTEILVVAEDGSQRKFVIRYNIVKTNVAMLSDLQMYNATEGAFASLPDFAYDKFEYTVELPWRTKVPPVLNPKPMLKGQIIEMTYGGVEGPTKIVVTAEDGVTKQTYTVNFKVKKSSVATLSAIYFDYDNLQEIPGFNPTTYDYTISLSYGTKSAPLLTWDLGEENGSTLTEQTVTYEVGNLYTPATIKVKAEDGTTQTYTIRYAMEGSGKENILTGITVGTIPVMLQKDVYNYVVDLPYGTKEIPTINIAKSFKEQSTFITSKGILGGTRIVVFSNDGVDNRTVYNLTYRVAEQPVLLTAIKIDGVELPIFDPRETSYIWNVEAIPTAVEAVAATGASILEETIDKNKAKVVVKRDEQEVTYWVHFYYPQHIIPNADFSKWEMAKYNNAQKPVGWMVPADAAEKCGFLITGEYKTGNEVVQAGDAVLLNTIYDRTPYGAIPGMMTIGTLHMDLKTTHNTTSSVSGGIPFYNTPNRMLVDYKPVSAKEVDNWRMLLKINDSEEHLYEGSFDGANTWQVASKDINTNIEFFNQINFTLNSAHSENAKQIKGTGVGDVTKEPESKLYVRNPRFWYNNLLAAVSVNNAPLDGFNPNVFEYTYTLEAENFVLPKIEMTGQVQDQQHRIAWSDEVNGERTATITVMAEDGSTQGYTIKFIRPASANKFLKSVKVNGVLLPDFVADKYVYSYSLPNMTRTMPNVEIEGANYNQTISYAFEGNEKFLITVKAENGDEQLYTINIIEEKDNVTALQSLSVDGYALAYDAAVKSYDVELPADAVAPYVFFKKSSEGQQVNVVADNDKALLKVTAQDGTAKATYTVNFLRPTAPSTAQLTSLSFNGYPVDGFAPDRYVYDYDAEVEPELTLHYTSQLPSDKITHIITADSVLLLITNKAAVKNVYRINCAGSLSADASLESLTCNYRPVDGFAPALTDYPVETTRLAYPHVAAKTYHPQAQMQVTYAVNAANERVFSFNTASEKGTQQSTLLRLVTPQETSTALGAILLNNNPLRENGDVYVSSSVYQPEVKDYTIRLRSASPKMTQPSMPNLGVIAGAYGQTVEVENNGISGDTYITVTSQSGDETTYTLKFAPELSSNVQLDNLLINYETIEAFQPKRYFYEIDLPKGSDLPVVSWQQADAFQTVVLKEYENRIDVVVTAENGDSETYQIDINWLPSNETNIESILSNGQPLDGFNPTIYDYFIELPVGTTTEPMLKIVAGAEGQSISITNGGVNGITTITVVAPDGVTTRDYRLHYNLLMSENNKLAMIYLNGNDLAGFNPEVRDYEVLLAMEDPTPLVTWKTGDDFQTVTRTTREDGTVVLTVVPQRAELKYEYIIRFSRAASKNANLRSIEIDGAVIEGFQGNTYNYTVKLPVGTDAVPYLSYTKAEEWQTVEYTEPTSLAEPAVIKVFAQDNSYTNTYYVMFERLLSDVDTLKAIFVGGLPLDNFEATQSAYELTLPYGTTQLPEISYEVGDSYQKVELVASDKAYTLIVTAENGQHRTYAVVFSIEKSANADLAAIYQNGTLLDGFDPQITDYEIALPYGTTELPRITAEKAEMAQTILIKPATQIKDTTYITVTAENGMQQEYKVTYVVKKSNNALLKAIYIDGKPLTTTAKEFSADQDFAPENMEYQIVLPVYSKVLPTITWEAQVAESLVEYQMNACTSCDVAQGTATLRVVAQDETDENEYIITFTTQLSANVLLEDITINGKSLSGFSPDTKEYVLSFPVGTDSTAFPTKDQISVTISENGQTYTVIDNQPNLLIIQVTAPDGVTKGTYVILSEIALSDNVFLADLTLHGNTIQGFDSTKLEYTYLLPFGAAEISLDWVGYTPGDEYQEVLLTTSGNVAEGDAAVNIFVTAQDGTEAIYTIHFVVTEDDPANFPSQDDICLAKLGDGRWRATSIRNNVQVFLYDMFGHRLAYGMIPVLDPNEKDFMCEAGSTTAGLDFTLPKKENLYVFTFVYKGKILRSVKVSH